MILPRAIIPLYLLFIPTICLLLETTDYSVNYASIILASLVGTSLYWKVLDINYVMLLHVIR